jgi:hypothetical protein
LPEFTHQKEIELAWAAGFFDGEGCFRTGKTNGSSSKFYPNIGISQAHPEVLKRFMNAVGSGYINGPYSRPPHKDMWYYGCGGAEKIRLVCNKLRPYLSSIKLKEMDEMLIKLENTRTYSDRLTKEEVQSIRGMYQQGKTMQEIANKYGKSAGHISDIINRKKWSNI